MTDARAEAAAAWRASVASDAPLSGAALARRFDKSPSWGRGVIAETRRVDGNGTNGASDAATLPPDARQTPPDASRGFRRVTVASVALVATVAAVASYSHMHHLALEAGESDLVAWLLPLSVDGLVVAASMSLLAAKRANRAPGALPWVALLGGLAASVAANVTSAQPTLVGRLVAAWPPVALALSFELLLRQTRVREAAEPTAQGRTSRAAPATAAA